MTERLLSNWRRTLLNSLWSLDVGVLKCKRSRQWQRGWGVRSLGPGPAWPQRGPDDSAAHPRPRPPMADGPQSAAPGFALWLQVRWGASATSLEGGQTPDPKPATQAH
jgi:hypothetical protein